MPDPKTQITKAPVEALTPELLDRMVTNQSQELQLRTVELQLQQQKDQNAFSFGKEALNTQLKDRNEHRAHTAHVRKCTYLFAAFIVALVVGLIAYALSTGKDAFASELMKAIFYLISGGAGGYGVGKSSKRTTSSSQKPSRDS